MSSEVSTGYGPATDAVQATVTAVSGALDQLQGPPDIAFLFCTLEYDRAEVLATARGLLGEASIIGSTTAGGYTEQVCAQAGVFVALIRSDDIQFYPKIATQLSKRDALTSIMQDFPADHKGREQLLFLLTDGLRNSAEETTLLVSSLFGADTTVAGGVIAEKDSDGSKGSVLFQDQLVSDAAAVTLMSSSTPFFCAVRHGHASVSPAVTVTRAEGHRIYTLDDQPAWSVWKRLTREAAQQRGYDVDNMSPEEEFAYRTNFQLGLRTGPDRIKARFINRINEDGSFNLAAAIPPLAQVHALDGGEPSGQVAASRAAAREVRDLAHQAGYHKFAGALVMECMVRQILLGERFTEARSALSEVLGGVPVLAVETYGEMLLRPGEFTGYHNASTVVILFVDEDGKGRRA